tara:strand:+ start:465 stop:755 length:291 start_codon:yes stop_codon:yes gene_type:complete
MEQGFKQLKGYRILLSLPPRDTKGIELSPELEEQLNKEYASKMDNLEVYAIGDTVEGLSIGDRVYVPVEELKRGTFININDEQKMMVSSMSVALIW